jgi:hypothetical protein
VEPARLLDLAEYSWCSLTSMGRRTSSKSSQMAGALSGCTPMPIKPDLASTFPPKISQMQISADRSGRSSKPIIQRATMQFSSSRASARSTNTPHRGVYSLASR